MKVLLRAVLFGVSFSARLGGVWFLLPHEKRFPWHFVEATFSPEGVRVR